MLRHINNAYSSLSKKISMGRVSSFYLEESPFFASKGLTANIVMLCYQLGMLAARSVVLSRSMFYVELVFQLWLPILFIYIGLLIFFI